VGIDYVPRTATASIHVGRDAYFENQTILEQFKRLFQLLEFKGEFKGHTVEVIVDNARYGTDVEIIETSRFVE
jgi:hypothetical protein